MFPNSWYGPSSNIAVFGGINHEEPNVLVPLLFILVVGLFAAGVYSFLDKWK